jgi:PhnB protein
MTVKPIPEGFHTVTPYLVVDDPATLIEFLKNAFDAKEDHRSTAPDGRIMHAQVKVGDSMVMIGGAMKDWKAIPAVLYLYVPDCDATYKKALGAGGVSIMEIANQPYGDRHGGVKDPAGNTWWVATHVEDVSPGEMEKRMKASGKHG